MPKRRKKKLSFKARHEQLKRMVSYFRPGTGLHKAYSKALRKVEAIAKKAKS